MLPAGSEPNRSTTPLLCQDNLAKGIILPETTSAVRPVVRHVAQVLLRWLHEGALRGSPGGRADRVGTRPKSLQTGSVAAGATRMAPITWRASPARML